MVLAGLRWPSVPSAKTSHVSQHFENEDTNHTFLSILTMKTRLHRHPESQDSFLSVCKFEKTKQRQVDIQWWHILQSLFSLDLQTTASLFSWSTKPQPQSWRGTMYTMADAHLCADLRCTLTGSGGRIAVFSPDTPMCWLQVCLTGSGSGIAVSSPDTPMCWLEVHPHWSGSRITFFLTWHTCVLLQVRPRLVWRRDCRFLTWHTCQPTHGWVDPPSPRRCLAAWGPSHHPFWLTGCPTPPLPPSLVSADFQLGYYALQTYRANWLWAFGFDQFTLKHWLVHTKTQTTSCQNTDCFTPKHWPLHAKTLTDCFMPKHGLVHAQTLTDCFMPKYWPLHAKTLTTSCQNTDLFMPKHWPLHAKTVTSSCQNTGYFMPKHWLLHAKTLTASCQNTDWLLHAKTLTVSHPNTDWYMPKH